MRIGFIHIPLRPDAFSRYYLWELRRNHPEHEVVLCAEEITSQGFRWSDRKCDVYLRIEDSGVYTTPLEYRPLVYYCGDTHVQDGVPRKEIAEAADYTFVAQKNATRAMGGFGDEWLPHAAYYVMAPVHPRSYLVSAAMVLGDGPLFGERTRLRNSICSYLGDEARIGPGPIHEQMAELYARSEVVWHHSVNNDVAMRHFEGAACGALVLSNRIVNNGLEDLFGDLVMQYDTWEELLQAVTNCREDRSSTAARGHDLRALVTAKHLYRHRLNRILEQCREWA